MTNGLLSNLRTLITQYKLRFTITSTIQSADQLLRDQVFHLLIVDLDYLRNVQQSSWLSEIRRNSFTPIIVLSDCPEQDTNIAVRFGADICVSGKWPCSMIADLVYAQLRRYIEYNHYSNFNRAEPSAFQMGDIYIDPARQEAAVCGRPVNLRHREFSLLLYFMRNPGIVLSAGQICENAWGMEYTQPIDRAIHELRKQIEPNPAQPRYIKTVYRVGYRFTAYRSELNCL